MHVEHMGWNQVVHSKYPEFKSPQIQNIDRRVCFPGEKGLTKHPVSARHCHRSHWYKESQNPRDQKGHLETSSPTPLLKQQVAQERNLAGFDCFQEGRAHNLSKHLHLVLWNSPQSKGVCPHVQMELSAFLFVATVTSPDTTVKSLTSSSWHSLFRYLESQNH